VDGNPAEVARGGDPPEGVDPRVDWAAEVRLARSRAALTAVVMVGWFAGILLLDGGFGAFRGQTAWLVVGSYVVVVGVVVLGVVLLVAPRARRGRSTGLLTQVALREHADPGPAVRHRVDAVTRQLEATRWAGWWVVPLISVPFLVRGRWGAPATAVPGALLVVLAVVAVGAQQRRLRADARAWAADPPGPPRDPPPVTGWERWTSGRRPLLIAAAAVVAALAVGTVAGLVAGSASR